MKNEKTDIQHWDKAWAKVPRPRLPSSLNIDVRNHKALLRGYVKRNDQVLEIGFAPGKLLLWVAVKLGGRVTGVDYSQQGLLRAKDLFAAMSVTADIRYEDVFKSTLSGGQFDVVYSSGLIEHFESPLDIVRRHVALAKPGGTVLILVPNYRGWMGRLQHYLDPENLGVHNLDIMTPDRLLELAPTDMVKAARAFYSGRFSPWLLSFERKAPRWLARAFSYGLNCVAHLQFVQSDALSPMLALEIVRK